MDFCKASDKYISLYLDEALDDKSRIEFLKHVEGCSQCATKLKEASYVADLCREDQNIQLPENFSTSLHSRLLEVSEKEHDTKFSFILHNRKLFTSLSTAAILVISLLAYNLLPHMGLSKDSTSIAYETAQDAAASTESGNSSNSVAKRSSQAGNNGTADSTMFNSTSENDTTASASEDSSKIAPDTKANITFHDELSPEDALKFGKGESTGGVENSSQARQAQGKTDEDPNIDYSRKVNEASLYIMAAEDLADTNIYFSNYAELNLRVTSQSIEIGNLRELMKELGAIELKLVTISSLDGNSAGSTVTTQFVNTEYFDYYLPLGLYSTIQSQATKYKLELSAKTDIIKTDISARYQDLNIQSSELDKKITEAQKKGENISVYEIKKTLLTKEINKIIAEKEMITVRVFFLDK